MVALTGTQVRPYASPDFFKVLTFEVRKVSTGDTLDVSAQTPTAHLAMFVASTVNVHAPCTIDASRTILTMPAGLTNDHGFIVVLCV